MRSASITGAGALIHAKWPTFLILGDLGTISGVFENLIGFICLLLLRSLVVPSTVKRTLICGVLMCAPTIVGVTWGASRFEHEDLSALTMIASASTGR